MTQDEIIEMAKQADLWIAGDVIEAIERFTKLVADVSTAKEREACAVLLDENAKKCSKDSMAQMILFSNATAIRARGQK